MHRVNDGINIFLVFFFRVGIVEAQVATAAVLLGEAEIEQDRFGMAEMQVAVWLWREASAQFGGVEWCSSVVACRPGAAGPMALCMLAGSEIGFDDVLDKVGCRCNIWLVGAAHGKTSIFNDAILSVRAQKPLNFPACLPCIIFPR